MTAWACAAAVCAACSVLLVDDPGVAGRRLAALGDPSDAGRRWSPDAALVLRLLVAALMRGAPIPDALRAVGRSCGGVCRVRFAAVADALTHGVPWDDAWAGARARVPAGGAVDGEDGFDEALELVEDALRPSWAEGVAAVPRLRAACDQFDALARARIERAAAVLAVRLLMPTGLCFLPAFLCIAVIPTVMSFAQR